MPSGQVRHDHVSPKVELWFDYENPTSRTSLALFKPVRELSRKSIGRARVPRPRARMGLEHAFDNLGDHILGN
jgi:hypothetical protein